MKSLKKGLLGIGGGIGLLLGIYFLTVHFHPSFGADLPEKKKETFETLKNFDKGTFRNRQDLPKKLSFNETVKLTYKYFTSQVENDTPSKVLEILKVDPESLDHFLGTRLVWVGHSTFLIQNEGKNILIDPMFSSVPAPLDFLGSKRFYDELPIEIEQLPKIDYVILSHDHYDHLDYESIQRLKSKVNQFLVPLGVGSHLQKWGIDSKKIIEMNWWEELTLEEIRFVCTPAQHFSGRKLSNGQETLWASWVILTDSLSLYFSGDSGYDIHFQQIGQKFGPFDISLLECGQYNKMWSDIHMFPNETVQAGIDLKSKKIIPIHWGAFKLALHPWNEPAINVIKEAQLKNLKIEIPKIGAFIYKDTTQKDSIPWWE
jgi:L-ascorbate metabolism protein UlaG (beta-lactamase superfamily)